MGRLYDHTSLYVLIVILVNLKKHQELLIFVEMYLSL